MSKPNYDGWIEGDELGCWALWVSGEGPYAIVTAQGDRYGWAVGATRSANGIAPTLVEAKRSCEAELIRRGARASDGAGRLGGMENDDGVNFVYVAVDGNPVGSVYKAGALGWRWRLIGEGSFANLELIGRAGEAITEAEATAACEAAAVK